MSESAAVAAHAHPPAGRAGGGPLGGDAVPESIAPQLGAELRRRRRAAGKTMQELAAECELSQPFLSQIENSQAMPSLSALHRVAQALGTTTVGLLDPAYSAVTLVRAGAGESFLLSDGATVRFLTPGDGHRLEANEITAKAGFVSDVLSHEGEELLRILEGSITVRLDGTDPIGLSAGDTLSYPATIPHEWTSGTEGARFIILSTPPFF